MPGAGPKSLNCVVCNKRTKPRERRSINESLKSYLKSNFLIDPTEEDVICGKCRIKCYQQEPKDAGNPNDGDTEDPDYIPPTKRTCAAASPPSVSLKVESTPKTHSRCIICKRPGPKLVVLSADARYNAFIQFNVLVAAGSRCCPVHLNDDGHLYPDCLNTVAVSEKSHVNRTAIVELMQYMRDLCRRNLNKIDFENITDTDCKSLTGLSRGQFEDLFSHVKDKIKCTPSRSPRTSLGLFLLKLRSGMSNLLLSVIFRISKSSIRRAINTVRNALMRGFVPMYLGLESIPREKVIQSHTRTFAKTLFGVGDDEMILVLDGTYIYVQKSQNFMFQRRSYSFHKSRTLVKPMIVVSTTGHYITVVGPYLADGKNNDASILNHMLRKNVQDIREYLKENDLLVVDRGFRDSLNFLDELGIKAAMPSFLPKGSSQMSTENANTSRLVTKVRWVVESSNARIKNWKYLDKVLPTNQIPFIGDFVRIVCAISNKYFATLNPTTCSDDDKILANQMRHRADQINYLQDYIIQNKLDRKTVVWQACTNLEDLQFPTISEEKLRMITCGVYQLRLSSSYIQEFLDGESSIFIHKENSNLIRVQLQSRHISAKKYQLWLEYSATDITAWYCKCRAGARVVGVCSHVASIIWYLGSARNTTTTKYGVQDWSSYLDDAGELPATVDSSDTDSAVEE